MATRGVVDNISTRNLPPRWPLRLHILLALFVLPLVGVGEGRAQEPKETPLHYQPGLLYQKPVPMHGQEIVKPFHIIGNVYYVGLSNNASYLITTPEGHFLLDQGFESTAPFSANSIEELGFHVKDIKYLIQAHAHVDHIDGLAAFKRLTGAKVLVMEQDADVLADGGKSEFRSDGSLLWEPVKADQIFHDGDQISLGGITMVAHLTAGHTKGCTTWSTTVEEDGHKYNAVFVCGMRMNEDVPLIGNQKYPNIADDFKKGFATLRSLPCDVFLSSHERYARVLDKMNLSRNGAGSSAWIDPQGYRSYIDTEEGLFLKELAKEANGR
jgi:metallo-beta-lactamase class B